MGSGGSPTRRFLAISGGVVEVRRDGASLLVDSAEWAEDIDSDRASESRQRAAGRLRRPAADIDATRAEAALSRALNRLQVSERAT